MVIVVVIIIIIIIIIMIVTVICIVYQGDEWTALMWASYNGHKEVVQLLLDHGAGIDIKSNVSIIYTIDCMYIYVWFYVYLYEYMEV